MKRFALLLLLACGPAPEYVPTPAPPPDPRESFIGTWSGATVATITPAGSASQSTQTTTTWPISIDASSSIHVKWDTAACHYRARVTTDESFVVEPVVCAPTTSSSGACTTTVTINQGSGTRTGTSLSVTMSGNAVMQCGSGPMNATFTFRFDGSKG